MEELTLSPPQSLGSRGEIAWGDIEPSSEPPSKGSFGVVFKGKWKGKVVAVKLYLIGKWAAELPYEHMLENLQREAGVLEKASAQDNENIVKYLGVAGGKPTKAWFDKIGRLAVIDEGSGSMIALVTRFEGGGNLRDVLVVKPCVIPMAERLRILTEVATGLFYLHRTEGKAAIIHGDIKPENVLFSVKRDVRLADFGLSKVHQLAHGADGSSHNSSLAHGGAGGGGTGHYMAPELYYDVGISRSTDMYAFGTLCWEVLSGLEPWAGVNASKRLVEILKGKTLDFGALPPNTPPSVVDMIRTCLAFGEDDHASGGRNARPSIRVAREVLENAYDMIKGGNYSVFLSYCWGASPEHARQPLTQQVYAQLRDAGFRVWMDVCDMGHNMEASMKEGIDNSECVVVLLSPDYVRSGNCKLELQHASESGKPSIVCMVEPGFWKTWKNADGSVCIDPAGELAVQWTKLEHRMYVDLAEASKVNWKDVDAVSAADLRKLTELPVAMPTLRRLLGELGVEPMSSYLGTGGDAGAIRKVAVARVRMSESPPNVPPSPPSSLSPQFPAAKHSPADSPVKMRSFSLAVPPPSPRANLSLLAKSPSTPRRATVGSAVATPRSGSSSPAISHSPKTSSPVLSHSPKGSPSSTSHASRKSLTTLGKLFTSSSSSSSSSIPAPVSASAPAPAPAPRSGSSSPLVPPPSPKGSPSPSPHSNKMKSPTIQRKPAGTIESPASQGKRQREINSAIVNGNLDALRSLTDAWHANKVDIINGVCPDIARGEGRSPLCEAAFRNRTDAIMMLVPLEGLLANQSDRDGKTALWWASYYGNLEAVRALCRLPDIDVHQAPITPIADKAKTPLMVACLGFKMGPSRPPGSAEDWDLEEEKRGIRVIRAEIRAAILRVKGAVASF